MEKVLFFTSPTQPHFIEIKNTSTTKKTFNVFFSGNNTNFFKLEGVSLNQYTSNTPYKATVDALTSTFLEVYPNCSCSTIDTYVSCRVTDSSNRPIQNYKLVLSLKSDDVTKDLNKYRPFQKGFQSFIKEDNETFALIQTNPYLTGNVKLKINSNGNVYLSMIDGAYQINDEKFYNRKVGFDSDLSNELHKLYLDLSLNTTDFYKYLTNDTGDSSTNKTFSSQIDDIYFAGAKNISKIEDDFSIFAPLYITNKIPKYFVVFKRNKVSDLISSDILKDVTIVKTFDLQNSEIGGFIRRTKQLIGWDKPHLKTSTDKDTILLEMTGIDLKSSTITTTTEDITSLVKTEKNIIDFEKNITEFYQNRKMVSHKIFNLEFSFSDLNTEDYNINSYFGMYVDDLELGSFNLESVDNQLFMNCLSFPKTNSIKIEDEVLLNNNFINKGNRIFYHKNNNIFHNIINYENKTLTLDKEVNLCDLTCKEDRIQIEDISKEYNPFVSFSVNGKDLDGLSFKVKNRVKTYEIIFEGISDEIFEVVSDGLPYNNTNSFNVSVDGNDITIPQILDIRDYQTIKLYNDDTLISETPIAYSNVLNNTTRLKLSDSVDLSEVNYIEYSNKSDLIYKVPKGITNEETINNLKNVINGNLPFRFEYVDGTFYIISTIRNIFDIQFDLRYSEIEPSDFKFFGVSYDPINLTVENDLYIPQFVEVSSTNILNKDEVVLKIDKFQSKKIDGHYRYTTSNKDYNILPFFDDVYTLEFLDKNIVKVGADYLRLELFKPCLNTFGIFSFYDVKKFNVERFKVNYDFIKQEFQHYFRNYKPSEKLLPNMNYKVDNLDNVSLRVEVKISVEGKFQYETVRTFTLSLNQSSTFSTFLSDYSRTSNEDMEFIYTVSSNRSPNETFRVYIEPVFNDTDFSIFEPEFPLNNYIDKNLDVYIKNEKVDKNPEYPYFKTISSEYDRLLEYAQTRAISDVINSKFLKWESWDSLDAKNQPNRFNYSLAFGVTNYNSYLTSFDTNMSAHTNEWFILEEYPNNQKVLEGSQNLYGFSKISDGMFLDESYDYFEEYFNNGTSNISTKKGEVKVSNKSTHSKIKRIANDTYETFFKGVKWRMFSSKDIEDYKFGIVVSTRPDCTPPSQSLVEHCPVEDVTENCKKVGILPVLFNSIKDLMLSNKNLNLKISVINENSLSFIEGVPKTKKIFNEIYTSNDFFNELRLATNYWKSVFDETFSTSNGWSYNLNVTFDRELETYPYPLTLSPISGIEKQANGVGDIRIGFSDLGNNDIAKTYYITTEDFETGLTYLTPTIILNSRVAFRKSDDTFNSAYSLAYVLAHELGHAFGLGHNTKGLSIMNPSIKRTYNLGSNINIGTAKECVEFIYGKYTDYKIDGGVESSNVIYSCDRYTNKKKDEFKFLVNDKFKTITLKIYVDIPSYLNLDGKTNFLNFYLNRGLKRFVKNGRTHSLEGLDVRIPNLNLSLTGASYYVDNLYSKTINPNDFLDPYTLGYSTEEHQYRLTGNKKYTIDYSKLKYEDNLYSINKVYDENTQTYKPYITEIGNGVDTTLDITFPLFDKPDWEELDFYKIAGGDTLKNGVYKLTLDYLLRIQSDIKFYDKSGEIESFMEFLPTPFKQIKINNTAFIDKDLKINNSEHSINLYRHDLNFDPSVQKVIHSQLREDLDVTTYYNIDFYRLNTKLLTDYEDFTSYNLIKRIITRNVPEGLPSREMSILDNKVVYNSKEYAYGGSLDKNTYKVFSNSLTSSDVSGFEDPYLFKKYLNSILVNLEDEIEYKVPESLVTWNLDGSKLTINIDKEKILIKYLYDKLSPKYSLIYTLDSSLFKTSLEKFIQNNFVGLYTLNEMYLITKPSNETKYIDQDGNIDRVLNSDVNVQTIEKTLSFDIDFILKINWVR